VKKILIILVLIIFNLLPGGGVSIATIRYVSHNSTPTPPYTTWETAADSIQKCIDYSVAGDTIIVANGIYYESLIVDKYLSLIGSSMDSTIIDGTGLANITVNYQADGNIEGFWIKGKGNGIYQTACILGNTVNLDIANCKLTNSIEAIGLIWGSSTIDNCIMLNIDQGVSVGCLDTCNNIIKNSVIDLFSSNYLSGISIDGGNGIFTKNIILGNVLGYTGIASGLFVDAKKNIIMNNIVSGFYDVNIEGFANDTAIVQNNVSSYANSRGYKIKFGTDMQNNISVYNQEGVSGPTSTNSDYNLYWQNGTNTTDSLAQHDIVANPMFVNDTIPVYGGSYDYHLQKYSPAIDAGDPNILDVDGTRSDIGVFGGPLGEKYTYQDLAPRPPVNLTAVLDSNQVLLSWNKNTEADFSSYRIYRDTTEGFIIDSTKLISEQSDTFFVQIVPKEEINLYYKLTAVDSQGNESVQSEEVHVLITGTIRNEQLKINNYKLYQNYPNPFNPSTRIGYRLKARGYVKLMVYDIKGEMIEVLVNKVQETGYYEVEFPGRNLIHQIHLASGIYLYRIEVIGEGRIPRFSDMKKMILLK
jgi:hypothetical protein